MGCFSFLCAGCGFGIESARDAGSEWLNDCVMVNPDIETACYDGCEVDDCSCEFEPSSALVGRYADYGRIEVLSYGSIFGEFDSDSPDDCMWFHEVCWVAAGRPDADHHNFCASESDGSQGWGYAPPCDHYPSAVDRSSLAALKSFAALHATYEGQKCSLPAGEIDDSEDSFDRFSQPAQVITVCQPDSDLNVSLRRIDALLHEINLFLLTAKAFNA
jgi:hypothetical protein